VLTSSVLELSNGFLRHFGIGREPGLFRSSLPNAHRCPCTSRCATGGGSAPQCPREWLE
jgi:hypothetical protein